MTQRCLDRLTSPRAPLGYLNQHTRDSSGREDAFVVPDPERADHITWAFRRYATGDISLSALAAALTERGLTTRPTTGGKQVPITVSTVRRLLSNPYYKGVVRFGDSEHPGQHPPLTDPVTWATVQDIIRAKRNGTRSRVHDHYLKGVLRCRRCGRQLMVHRARSKSGRIYEYFVCSSKLGAEKCPQGAIPLAEVERRVEDLWGNLPASEGIRRTVSETVTARTRRETAEAHKRLQEAQRVITDAEPAQSRMIDLLRADAMPGDIFLEKTEQLRN